MEEWRQAQAMANQVNDKVFDLEERVSLRKPIYDPGSELFLVTLLYANAMAVAGQPPGLGLWEIEQQLDYYRVLPVRRGLYAYEG